MFILLARLDYESFELLAWGMLIVVVVVQSLSTGSPRVRGGGNQSLWYLLDIRICKNWMIVWQRCYLCWSFYYPVFLDVHSELLTWSWRIVDTRRNLRLNEGTWSLILISSSIGDPVGLSAHRSRSWFTLWSWFILFILWILVSTALDIQNYGSEDWSFGARLHLT